MAASESATARKALAELEKKLSELEQTKTEILSSLGGWTGPVIQLCITADKTQVVTSTEVIGKAEFSASLFRERMEEDLRTEDELSDDIVVELWFDRNGFSLPIILSAMRGYDCSSLMFTLTKYEKEQIFVDCKYYRLPSLLKKLFPRYKKSSSSSTKSTTSTSSAAVSSSSSDGSSGEKSGIESKDDQKSDPGGLVLHEKHRRRSTKPKMGATAIRGFDKRLMDSINFLIDPSNNVLRKNGGSGRWQCVGVTGSFITGKHSIKFKIKKGGFLDQMFGIIERKYFSTEGYFGNPLRGIGFHTYSGDLYTAGNNHIPFGKKPSVGDVIGITVNINSEDKSKSTITFLNNDQEIGSKPLSEHISLDVPLIFAVVLYHKGDEVQIMP